MRREKTRRRLVLITGAIALAILAAGCSTVPVETQVPGEIQRYAGVPSYPPTDPSTVKILRTAPKAPHVKLGEITLEPQGNPSVTYVEIKLRQAAAEMGANAVVIVVDRTRVEEGVVTGWSPWWGGQGYSENTNTNLFLVTQPVSPQVRSVIVGVAIRYTK